jgi:hypothetical protein
MKSIIESQNKLMPKYYQNSYYKRRNSYSYGNSNYNNQLASQIASQLAKTFIAPSTSFFPEGGEDPLQARNNYQPTFQRSYCGGKRGRGPHGNRKY